MEQRRDAIVELVNQVGSVSFSQLKEVFPDVSEMTLRTDLKVLDQARRIVRVHGGARSVDMVVGTDDYLSRRTGRSVAAKQVIAQKALDLIHPNDTFFLDSGSTATTLARCIPDEPYLIYTSGLTCAEALARLSQPQVCIAGGVLNRYSMSVCGIQGLEVLKRVNFDLMFLSVTSYSPEAGFCCGVEDGSILKRTVLERSAQIAVLMDSSKLGLRRSFTICGLEDVDIIVSDGQLPEDFLEECRRLEVIVY